MIKSTKNIAVLCILFASSALLAQTPTFGKFSFSAGVGLVPTFLADNASVNTLPVNARITYQVNPSFNLSGFFGYSSSTSSSAFIISDGQQSLVSNKMTMYGLRGELKKNLSKKFEVYGGALLGFNQSDIREFDQFTGETINRDPEGPSPFNPNRSNTEWMYAGFVGSTFYLHKNIGLFAEVGYGISLLNTGVTVRL